MLASVMTKLNLDKWLERIYEETDIGRAIATTFAGCTGISVYLYWGDWVVATFTFIITFPIVRVLTSAMESKWTRSQEEINSQKRIKELFDNLGTEERAVVDAFIWEGGNTLTWRKCNESWNISDTGVESLINRGMMYRTVTADGMSEAFSLDTELFDYAQAETFKNF